MENSEVFERLNLKIEELLKKFQYLKEENDNLRKEVVTQKALSEAKENEIEKLQGKLAKRDREIEEIILKIEKMMEQ